MAQIVSASCVDCRYTDCCTVCPVDWFYEVEDPGMLVIDPDTSIDCELCVLECPVSAIYPEDELPQPYEDWKEINAELFGTGTNITEKKEPLPPAITLGEIEEREQKLGWLVDEPSKAS